MNNQEARDWLISIKRDLPHSRDQESLNVAIAALEQMDRVKMVELKHIHQWAEDWKYDCCGRLSIEKLLGFFCKDHGILIEPKPVKKWIWFKVDKFTTSRSNAHMSMAQMREMNIMGWSQDLSTEIEE